MNCKFTEEHYIAYSHCWSVTKSCITHCDPMDWSTPGSPVLHYLLEFPHICVCLVIDAIQPSYPLSPFSPQSSPASGSFWMSCLFTSGGQSIGASASVLPMDIQGWFPLGLTGLISLQSNELSRVFSNTVQKHQLFSAQPSLWTNICTWLLEKL